LISRSPSIFAIANIFPATLKTRVSSSKGKLSVASFFEMQYSLRISIFIFYFFLTAKDSKVPIAPDSYRDGNAKDAKGYNLQNIRRLDPGFSGLFILHSFEQVAI